MVFLHQNKELYQAIKDSRMLLRESMTTPTWCRELVAGWPEFIGVKDASGQGVGGVVFGEALSCPPTVFWCKRQADIKASLVSFANPQGTITNSNLEMVGLLLLFLVMEEVCGDL